MSGALSDALRNLGRPLTAEDTNLIVSDIVSLFERQETDRKNITSLLARMSSAEGRLVSQSVDYTPTFNSGFSMGSGGTQKWTYTMIGSGLVLIEGCIKFGATPHFGGGSFTFTLPKGMSINNARQPGIDSLGSWARCGSVACYDSSAGRATIPGYVVRNAANSYFGCGVVEYDGTDSAITGTQPFTWAQGDELFIFGVLVDVK